MHDKYIIYGGKNIYRGKYISNNLTRIILKDEK